MKSHPFTYQEAERFFLRLLHKSPCPSRPHIRQLHGFLFRHGVYVSNLILSHFIARFSGDVGGIPYACRIFNHACKPNVLLFNSLIKLHSLHPEHARGSFAFYDVMRARGILPDEFTFAPLLKSCNAASDVWVGSCVHGQVTVGGYQSFKAVRIGVVELYAEHGEMGNAQKAFEEMNERDSVVVCNILVNGFFKAGDVDTGLSFFQGMGNRNVVSWNTVISCLGKSGRYSEAMEVFREMVSEEGFSMDEATVVSILPVCAKLGDVASGDWVKECAEKEGILKEFQTARNAVIDFYCKSGNMEKALEFFRSIGERNEVTWNAMITGMAYNGKELVGVELFEEMVRHGVTPNSSSFVGVLTCCSHAGLIDTARTLFALMRRDYSIEPKLEHYGCMLDLLGRTGCIREAFDIIREMPMKANSVMWGSLLSACRTHGELELAKVAVKELIRLEPSNSGNYVLLSNLYAETGRWDAVEVVRESMRGNSIWKEPGRSAVGS